MNTIKKYISYTLGTIIVALSLHSCNFLNIPPENKQPEEEIDFTKTEDMYEVVSGTYAKVRTGGMHWVIWPLTIVRDDDIWSGRVDDQVALVDFGNYKYDNAFWGLNEVWNQYYGIIKVANAALTSLDAYAEHIPANSEWIKKYHSYSGEVRFLRAYAYYRLVQAFGSVTILESNTQTDLRRSTIQDVYKYMLTDLEYTMQHTPKLRPNQMEHKGAVTAYSAAMLAAKVHLNMGDYKKVEELTDDIINNGSFELYPNFYQLFKIPGKLSNESLFEVQNTDFGQGSGEMIDPGEWFVFQGPANNTIISGWGFIGIYPEFRNWARERGESIRATTSFLEAGTTTPSGDAIMPAGNPTHTDCWNGKAYTPIDQLTLGRTKVQNHALVNYNYCVENPKNHKGYGHNSWGLTASYSPEGYRAHQPGEDDLGVITPTAALSSFPYTPEESMSTLRGFYEKRDWLWGKYGFYDAYCEAKNWVTPRYLAIDQCIITPMIENYRTGLLWDLFMSCPEVQAGLNKLGFTY